MNWKLSVSRHCFIFEIFNGMKYTVQIFLNHLNKFFNVDRVEFLMYGNQYFNVPLPPLRFYTRIGSSTCTNLRASCNMNGNKILHWPRSLSNMMYAYLFIIYFFKLFIQDMVTIYIDPLYPHWLTFYAGGNFQEERGFRSFHKWVPPSAWTC